MALVDPYGKSQAEPMQLGVSSSSVTPPTTDLTPLFYVPSGMVATFSILVCNVSEGEATYTIVPGAEGQDAATSSAIAHGVKISKGAVHAYDLGLSVAGPCTGCYVACDPASSVCFTARLEFETRV